MVLQKTKKFLCTAVALFVGVSAIVFTSHVFTYVEADAAFEQNATELVEDIELGWNLGNSLDAYVGTTFGCQGLSSETSWGNPYTNKALIDMVHDSGINAIRVPVTWYNHMDPDTYQIDEAWMNRVEEVVNYVLDDNMYCILNVHHDTGEKGWITADPNNYDQKEKIFVKIWEQISERFNKYGDKLLFEGYNEILNDNKDWWLPSNDCFEAANTLNQAFVDTVRASGGNNAKRCLIVNTYAGQPFSQITTALKVPTDTIPNRIIVEAHVYTPFQFTYEGYPDVTTFNPAELDEVLTYLNRDFVKKGYPCIVGEFGLTNKKDNHNECIAWIKQLVDMCTDYGIKCFFWDNGQDYSVYNRNNLTVSDP